MKDTTRHSVSLLITGTAMGYGLGHLAQPLIGAERNGAVVLIAVVVMVSARWLLVPGKRPSA